MTPTLDRLQTPALLVDLPSVRANIARTIELLDGDPTRWRPHVKTAKIPEILDLVLAAGVVHFKCATTKEARTLLERARAPIDLLVAIAHQGANLDAIAALASAHPRHRVSMLSEDPRHVASIRAASARLGVFVDLDPGFRRSGIPLADRERIAAACAASGPALRGLHCYDGHVRAGDAAERDATCDAIYRELVDVADRVANGHAGFELVTSGTPTFPIAARHPLLRARLHRASPGTVVYWDTTSEAFGITGYRFAVTVLTRVVSRPQPDRITCDAGSKALDAAAGDPCCTVADRPGMSAQHPSEEHLPLHVASGSVPELGTLLRLVPRHVCPTVNLADEAVLMDGDDVVAIVPVAARGHDTGARNA